MAKSRPDRGPVVRTGRLAGSRRAISPASSRGSSEEAEPKKSGAEKKPSREALQQAFLQAIEA
jgi:hypothetical protein